MGWLVVSKSNMNNFIVNIIGDISFQSIEEKSLFENIILNPREMTPPIHLCMCRAV